jgi:ELWxxDGT repeat protein
MNTQKGEPRKIHVILSRVWLVTIAVVVLLIALIQIVYGQAGRADRSTVITNARNGQTDSLPVLVKDINSGTLASSPSYLVVANKTVYFAADDGLHGNELWKSSGSLTDTLLVMDIYTGTTGSNPVNLINVQGVLFFVANDGIHGSELWRSDGTVTGTHMVKDIYTGTIGSDPRELMSAEDTLFFVADDGVHGQSTYGFRGYTVWRSDGTPEGTVMVGGFRYYETPYYLTEVKGTLFFNSDGPYGSESYKSNGTPGSVVLVKDIRPGYCWIGNFYDLCSSSPKALT